MANADLFNPFGFTDKRKVQGTNTHPQATRSNYLDVSSMRTYLAGQGYSTANLDLMTYNDLVYAVRLKQDAAGV